VVCLEKKRCEYCHSRWQWTVQAYSGHMVLQVGCWGCGSIYNVVDDELMLVRQSYKHFIFKKDITIQWDKLMNK